MLGLLFSYYLVQDGLGEGEPDFWEYVGLCMDGFYQYMGNCLTRCNKEVQELSQISPARPFVAPLPRQPFVAPPPRQPFVVPPPRNR